MELVGEPKWLGRGAPASIGSPGSLRQAIEDRGIRPVLVDAADPTIDCRGAQAPGCDERGAPSGAAGRVPLLSLTRSAPRVQSSRQCLVPVEPRPDCVPIRALVRLIASAPGSLDRGGEPQADPGRVAS